jgi:3-oxoadipate enol-lactonase
MASKRIRGIKIAYDDLGAGDALVFIHGHPFNRSMWDYQLDHFKGDYRLILPDLRGYGDSDVSFPRVLLDEMALDIAHLLDELGIDQAVFCGLSMGGQIVLDFYRLFPGRVKAIIIADSDARGETPESYDRRLLLAETILKDGMKKYTDEHIHEYIAPASIQNQPAYDHLYTMMTHTKAEGAAAAHRGRAERRDHLSILPSINVPALIVVGSADYFTPLPVAEIMSNLIPDADLVCINGAGHLPNMETPTEFNRALRAFLTRVDVGRDQSITA